MKNKKAHKNFPSSQEHLYIGAIRNDVVILKDGSLRSVIEVNSINFGLKSIEEQESLVNSYVAFLNTLKYPLQISIRSRKFNVNKYIKLLDKQLKMQRNPLLRKQIEEYRHFIVNLVDMGDIMTKHFYVVVPYYGEQEDMKTKSFWTRFQEAFTPAVQITLSHENFLKKHRNLMLRVSNVMSGLSSLSLNPKLLTTKELIALYYDFYNPVDNPEQEEIDDMTKIRMDIV